MTAARKKKTEKTIDHPFRVAVFRGLAVVLPPLLTIVILLWIAGTVGQYVLGPVTGATRSTMVWFIADIIPRTDLAPKELAEIASDKNGGPYFQRRDKNGELKTYEQMVDENCIPKGVADVVKWNATRGPVPTTSGDVYDRYVEILYLRPYLVIPFFLSIFVLILYLLGKFMAAGIGRVFWGLFERGVDQLPLVRNVYGAVKQVSDFILAERDVEFSRVVAVEWPRKGIWSLALVTGESMIDIQAAANEPVLSVLIPTSPMPMTGFALTVKKSETIDLNISLDQALQFIVSCGVVVPPEQMAQATKDADSTASLLSDDDSQDVPDASQESLG